MNREEYNKRLFLAQGNPSVLQVLLIEDAKIRAENDRALLFAVRKGCMRTVNFLLLSEPNIGALTRALSEAGNQGRWGMGQILLQAGADSKILSFRELQKFLTPKFILSLSDKMISALESSHPEAKKYQWPKKKSLLKSIKGDDIFSAKISLADLYYRPGEYGYYQAISF